MELLILCVLLLFVIGGIVLLVLSFRRRSISLGISGVLCLLMPVIVVGLALNSMSSMFPAPVTDPQQYSNLIRKAAGSPLYAHFPKAIPAAASHVRFYYDVGPMQAPMVMALAYRLSDAEIWELYKRFDAEKIERLHGGEGSPASDRTPVMWVDKENRGREFSSDYVIFFLKGTLNGPDNWNHPFIRAVALSRKRGEVVYWVEDW